MVEKLLKNMDWLGLTNLSEIHYSPHLVNEFYSGILLKKSESSIIVNFDDEVIYTFFDGRERELTATYLGNLLSCRHYTSPHEVPDHFSFDIV